jgi:hypothetical protein
LKNNPNINRLEIVLSGEDLKWLKQRQE